MTSSLAIEPFLEQHRIPFSTFTHSPAYTAQEQAAAAHIPGWHWAKSVVCIADGRPIFAVLPAPCEIDFNKLERLSGATQLRLATEDELTKRYPGCEGAPPPFGLLYGQAVFVDRRLVGDPELVFDAGSRTRAIRMHYADFVDVAHPVVGSFAIIPGSPRENSLESCSGA